jgi:hypothetical protein
METASGRTGYAVGRRAVCHNYENNLLLCLKKVRYFFIFVFRKSILDIYKCPFFKKATWVCEKPWKKRLVTIMLSFSKIGEICCEHNFFNTF